MVKVSKCADCGDSLSVCLAGTLCPASMREMWRGVCGDLGRGEGCEDRLTGAEHDSGAEPLHGAWNRRGTVAARPLQGAKGAVAGAPNGR